MWCRARPKEDDLSWENTSLIPADGAIARLRDLRDGDGGTLCVMGRPTLVRTLLTEGLVDELNLMVEPVLLGGGKSIFPTDGGLRTLDLVSTVTTGTGVNICTYRPAAS